jgi:hypothetical protein
MVGRRGEQGAWAVLVLVVLVLAALPPCRPIAGRPTQAPRRVPRLRGGGGGGGGSGGHLGVVDTAGPDCSGEESLVQRLQMEETRAAAAEAAAMPATGRGAHRRERRRPPREPPAPLPALSARSRSGEGTPLLATQLLADAESRAICRHLGDRGFEGTGAAVVDRLGEEDDTGQYGSASRDLAADEQYLLGAIGRVVWAGANRVLGLPRAVAELGARCVPVAGGSGEDECGARGAACDKERDEASVGRWADEDECANDEALARALQECEWYDARQHGGLPATGDDMVLEGAGLDGASRRAGEEVGVVRRGDGRVGIIANGTASPHVPQHGRRRDSQAPETQAESGRGRRRRQRSPHSTQEFVGRMPHVRSRSRAAAREFEREWQELRDEFASQEARRPMALSRHTLASQHDRQALGRGVWLDPSEMTYDEILQMQDMIGFVSRGADAAQIAALPSETYRACGEGESRGGVECSACCVCLEDFLDGEAVRKLECCHRFHVACIDPWLASNRACPICKADAC